MNISFLRPDLQAVADLVPEDSRVLDIACGAGELLTYLRDAKGVDGRGIEIAQEGVSACVASGLSVIQGDADTDLQHYPDKAFDYAILSKALQALRAPREALLQMTRISERVIVSIPNFGHWRSRCYLMFRGRMPVTKSLPYEWYNTPNIHFCTIRDFIVLCEELGISIEKKLAVNGEGAPVPIVGHGALANLFSNQGVFLLRG